MLPPPARVDAPVNTLGIIGAGKVGTALGRLATAAGWSVLLAGSPRQAMQALIIETMVPGARLVSEADVVKAADIVVIAIPFSKSSSIDWTALDGKIVVDAMNHWHTVDGPVPDHIEITSSTAEYTRDRNPAIRLVKSFNHLGYHELETDARPAGDPDRRGMAVASDHEDAAVAVARLVDGLGFDPVITGLADGHLMEPDGPVFGIPMPRDVLVNTLTENGARSTRVPDLAG